MRFTPNTNWSIANSAAFRKVAWTTEVRIVTSLSDALFSGTWTRIDSFIHEIDDIRQAIEYNPGQFTSDNITLTVGNIAWWDTNFLTTANYIEFRRLPSIGIGSAMMSADSANAFHGFIDNREGQLHYSNETDEVTFSVYTPDDIGSRISALNVNTQYFNADIDGGGTDGLYLPKIRGVYVQDSNISSYVLKKGFHTLTYQYNAGTEQMKLDDGDFISLPGTDGTVDLVNGDGDQKIKLYVDVSEIPTDEEIEDYVIVITAGDTLPRQPYYGVAAGFILRKLYAQIGFTNANVTTDTLQFVERDAIARYSYYDIPPEDITKTGEILAAANNGTDIFVGVGDSVYKRTMSDDSYTLITTKTNYTVKRLWYNARNNDLWIWFNGASDKYVRIYHLTGATSDEVDVTSYAHFNSADLMDFNYSGSNYKYGLCYTNKSNAADFRFISSNGTDTQVFTAANILDIWTGTGALNTILFVKDGNVYFNSDEDSVNRIHGVHVVDATNWGDDGILCNSPIFSSVDIPYVMLHKDEGKIYYRDSANVIKTVTIADGTIATVATLSSGYGIDSMLYANGQIYCNVLVSVASVPRQSYLYSLDGGSATLLNSDSVSTATVSHTLNYFDGTLYGVDWLRRLWRYSSDLQMYYRQTVWNDISVKEAINQCLGTYNLIGKISAHKKVNVLRRGNDAGTKQTTGSAISINSTNCAKVQKIENSYPAVAWVEISNGTTTHSYDGTNFDTAVLSNAKTFTLSSPLIPTERIKDIAVYNYAFWSVARSTYQFEMLGAPMEYEVMDGADVTINDQYVNLISSQGLIIGQTINNFGRCIFDVLF